MSFKIFISYTSADRDTIEPFLGMLKAIHGLTYFFYEETKAVTKGVKEDIVNNLCDSDAFLVFRSKNSLAANYVQHEIGGAVALGKQVIIANLDGSKPDGMLDGVNYLDFANERLFKHEIDKLINWIKSKIPNHSRDEIVTSDEVKEENGWAGLLILASLLAGFYLLFGKKA